LSVVLPPATRLQTSEKAPPESVASSSASLVARQVDTVWPVFDRKPTVTVGTAPSTLRVREVVGVNSSMPSSRRLLGSLPRCELR
jgi:hypothetical protein